MPVNIVSDDGQSGKTGDDIVSRNGADGEKHYVSPKKSAEITDDFVVLKIDTVTEDVFSQTLTWECSPPENGSVDPDNPRKFRVKRDDTVRAVVKVKSKIGGATLDTMNVWIVWAEVQPRAGTIAPLPDPDWFEFRISPETQNVWKFLFTIQPATITSADERPALSGVADDRKRVPGHDKPFPIDHDLKADTADFKWDVSRQVSISLRNSGLISKAKLEEHFTGDWTKGQPILVHSPVSFPENPVEGNDDPFSADEDNNPYEATEALGLEHAVGQLASYDGPGWAELNSWGSTNGQKFSAINNFLEFARVQLWNGKRENGQFWFKISNHTSWHHSLKAEFSAPPGKWVNTGSTSALGSKAP